MGKHTVLCTDTLSGNTILFPLEGDIKRELVATDHCATNATKPNKTICLITVCLWLLSLLLRWSMHFWESDPCWMKWRAEQYSKSCQLLRLTDDNCFFFRWMWSSVSYLEPCVDDWSWFEVNQRLILCCNCGNVVCAPTFLCVIRLWIFLLSDTCERILQSPLCAI